MQDQRGECFVCYVCSRCSLFVVRGLTRISLRITPRSFATARTHRSKDGTHSLYAQDDVWRLAHEDKGLYYEAVTKSSTGPHDPSSWVVGKLGKAPVPTAITPGDAPTKSCSCVHAVPCPSCHNTASGEDGPKYFSGTAAELADCSTAASTEHLQWQQLFVSSGSASAGMLMSGGLCLEAPTKTNLTDSAIAALPMLTKPRENPREVAFAKDPTRALGPISAVRVTVTATNGIAQAHINEIRLYGSDGELPFPKQPTQA